MCHNEGHQEKEEVQGEMQDDDMGVRVGVCSGKLEERRKKKKETKK